MPLNDRIEQRISEAEKARRDSAALVRALQQSAFLLFSAWFVENLETGEDGEFKDTAANLLKVAAFYKVFQRWNADYQKKMLGSVTGWASRIFDRNREYFEEMNLNAAGVDDVARAATLKRWGYSAGKVVPGGYFEYLFDNRAVAQRLAGIVNRAMLQKMTLPDFQRTFKSAFVGRPGQGMLERHWRTNSFDLYQRLDRTANLLYADGLDLNNAIYSGTLEEDSRPFCIARVNKVYSRKEILSWKNLSFSGKPKIGYDPFTDCGGHNCRHHLSWITDELAENLKAR